MEREDGRGSPQASARPPPHLHTRILVSLPLSHTHTHSYMAQHDFTNGMFDAVNQDAIVVLNA